MHIILVPNRLATARTLTLTPRLLTLIAGGFLVSCLVMAFAMARVGVHFGLPLAQERGSVVPVEQLVYQEEQAQERLEKQAQQTEQALQVQVEQQRKLRRAEDYLSSSVSSMAEKLGEMQAKLLHLDSLSERVSKLTGVNAPKSVVGKEGKDSKDGKDGKGGPLIKASQPLSVEELQQEIDRLATAVDERSDTLSELESQLMERRIDVMLLPTITPIVADHIGSPYGRRVDPIAGVSAMHEGIDFVADQGTPVNAAAGGIVVSASYHPQYGNLIEIDHGNEFSSRYAHLSKFDVTAGQVVKRGQTIGATGNTGRSTGPHLHFEVRFKGASQNPDRFLKMGNQLALNALQSEPEPVAAPDSPAPAKSRKVSKKSR